MAKEAVGMEIHQRAIRVVGLRRGRKGPELVGRAKVPLPSGVVTRSGVQDPARFQAAVTEVMEQAGVRPRRVAIALHTDRVDIRVLEFPRMPDAELTEAIRLELRSLIRFDIASEQDLWVDHHPLGGDEAAGEARPILVIAVPRTLVWGYLAPLRAADVYPDICDVGGFSLPWALPRAGRYGHLLLGPELIHLTLYSGTDFALTRHVSVQLEPLLALHKVGEAESARSRLEAALLAEEMTDGPITKAVDDLIEVVQQTLEYHRAQERAHELSEVIESLVISGEVARVDGLRELIGEETGVHTVTADPLIGPGQDGRLGVEAAAYAVSVGLALRGLDEK